MGIRFLRWRARIRLRPTLMTPLTFILGVMPLAVTSVSPDMGNLTVPPSVGRPHARCVHGAAGLGYGAGGWRLTPNGRGRSACVVNGRLRHAGEGRGGAGAYRRAVKRATRA